MFSILQNRLCDFGITRLSFIDGLGDCPISVSQVFRPSSRSLTSSSGKGFDPISSLVAGIMESLELMHAEQVEKQQEKLICVNKSHFCHDNPSAEKFLMLMGIQNKRDFLYPMFQSENLTTSTDSFVPWESVMMIPTQHDHKLVPSSNGLASGSNIIEASISALCEIIERDSEAMSYINKNIEVIDLSSIINPELSSLIETLEQLNLLIKIEHLSNPYSLPVMRCILWNKSGIGWEGPFGGCAADVSRDRSLIAAITEALQAMVIHIAGARDDIRFNPSKKLSSIEKGENPADFNSVPDYPGLSNQVALLDFLLSMCKAANINTVHRVLLSEDPDYAVVKLTSPDMSFIHHGHPKVIGYQLREAIKANQSKVINK